MCPFKIPKIILTLCNTQVLLSTVRTVTSPNRPVLSTVFNGLIFFLKFPLLANIPNMVYFNFLLPLHFQ